MDTKVLRVVTAGSVDNGKSTLIGRLLYDSKKILNDQLENIEEAKLRYGNENINLAFLTDGLKAEREQGITIDVAYRYFHSNKRKYILIDCPGHLQYTKNMITGSSAADAAIILVDGKDGFTEQSRRHTYLSMLLGVSHVIFAINKMDLLQYSQSAYDDLCASIIEWLPESTKSQFHFLPSCALVGDNIVQKSTNMMWYEGKSLIDLLDDLVLNSNNDYNYFRFPVQWVIKPQSDEFPDYRAYAGTIVSGNLAVGDEVMVFPSALKSKVKQIQIGSQKFDRVNCDLSPSIMLEDDLDISRGSLLASPKKIPQSQTRLEVMFVGLHSKPIVKHGRYLLKHNSKWIKVIIEDIMIELNLHNLKFEPAKSNLGLNAIGKISLSLSEEIFFDSYTENKAMGSAIIVDESSNETIGAVMLI